MSTATNPFKFIDGIGEAAPVLVYLFCPGKSSPRAKEPTFEPFLAERAVQAFIDAYVDPTLKDLCFSVYYADETDPAEIVLTAQTLPFLAERRVLLVRAAETYMPIQRRQQRPDDEDESAAGPLLNYLGNPNDTSVLLLIAARVDRRTRFFKACDKAGQVIECPQLSRREVEAFVRAEAQRLDKRIEQGAVAQLIDRAGVHLADVHNALTNVVAFIGDAAEIGEDDVARACADVAEEDVWKLTDAIAASQPGEALRVLRRITDMGKEPDAVLGMINRLLKDAYAVAVAGKGRPSISPYFARKVAPLADKLGLRKLRDAFALLTDTQFFMRSTGVDTTVALELLVLKLACPMPRTGSA